MANILEFTFDQFTWPVVYLEVVSNAAWLIETDLNTHQPIVDVNSLKNMAGQQMMLKNQVVFSKHLNYQRQYYVAKDPECTLKINHV